MIRPLAGLVAVSALLAACGPSEPKPAKGGLTQNEASSADGLVVPTPNVTIPQTPSLRGPTAGQPAGANPDATTPDEAQIARALLADPSAYPPVTYVYVTKYLWERGDRLQAAFWHTLFQIRTAPYLKYDRDLGPLRASVNEVLGGQILRWLGSDYAAWEDVTRRAISFERRAPLNREIPEGVTPTAWAAEVEAARRAWQADFDATFGPSGPGRAAVDAQRRANGLPVGPLQNPGAPLPADWR